MLTRGEERRGQRCASYELAAELLVQSTTGKLLAHARSCGLDAAASEDVVQDAFTLFYEKRPQLENIEAWLVCVVRRRCLDWIRAQRAYERALARALAPRPASTSHSPLERLALQAACEQLPPRHRALLSARFFDGHSESASAAATGYSPKSFKKTMTRILRRLRSHLEKAAEPPSKDGLSVSPDPSRHPRA